MDGNKSIKELVQDLGDRKILLPEFQRNFTWSIEQTVDLFDSISRGIFIGALILSKPKFSLSCREIDKRPRKGVGKLARIHVETYTQRDFEVKNVEVLLDGQQRATSLFRALKGIGGDEIYFVFKPSNKLSTANEEIDSLEEVIEGFSSKPKEDRFCVPVSHVYNTKIGQRESLIKENIFNPAIENYPDFSTEERELYFSTLINLTAKFHHILNDKTLLSVFLLDMDLEKFCMFFERSNSKGVALNFVDIITAKIYKGFNLREKKEEFKEKHNDRSIDDNQIIESFVRYLCYLEKGAVDKKTILESLTDTHFSKNWKLICELYVKAKNILSSQKMIYNIEAVPNKTMFIPLMHFINHLPKRDFSQATLEQQGFLKFWFWSSMLNTRYGGGMIGSTNDIIVEDCDLLERIALNKIIRSEDVKKFRLDFNVQELYDLTSNKGAQFVAVMSLLNYRHELKELTNHGHINFKEETNIHHIFPRKYIKETFEPSSFAWLNVDSILNKMIIGKLPNIQFNKKSPSAYLAMTGPLSNKKLNASLSSHSIPNPEKLISGYYDNKFKAFLDARYELITDIISDEVILYRESLMKDIEKKEARRKKKRMEQV